MQPVSAFVVFVIIWWLVIFCVLPIGLSTTFEEADEDEGYRLPGAPKTLDMKKKLWITTGVSFVLWLLVMGLIMSGLFDFYEYSFQE